MKRFFAAVLLLMGVFPLYAQHINSRNDTELAKEIMQDTAFEQYVWAVGFGDDLETADSSALTKLSSSDLNLVTQYNSQTRNEQINIESAKTTDIDEIKITGASMVYLENIRRIELFNYEYNGTTFPYFVLRYVTAEQWSKRHDGLKDKINKYLDYAEYSVNVTEQLRCYVWALALLKQYNKGDIKVNNMAADQYAMSKITEILDDIEISVTAIREQKGDKNYPYTLYLDFMYEGEPISNLSFRYFDGCGYIDDSIKDGRSMINMKKLTPTLKLNIDCYMENEARVLDPGIQQCVKMLSNSAPFTGSRKEIEIQPKGVKPQKEVDTNNLKHASAVTESLKKSESEYGHTTAATNSESYTAIMDKIVKSFTDKSISVREHFTDSGWDNYEKIVSEGNPVVARTPSWRFIKHDTLIICRELPVKLKFPSARKPFIEDVVFRINERTKKIESVAYKLGAATESSIMAKEWDERDRLTLITFLEDYRSAYCLRDIGYIKKVFSNDAYIIVGKVLQKSTKKFNDKTDLLETDGNAVYTRYSKKEYVAKLSKSFLSKEFVNVRFEECDVCAGQGPKRGIYAVQVRQLYSSNNYADEGILTLAIDMRNDINPLVRVRVWQQERDVNYTAEQMMVRTVSTEGSFNHDN
ncbi:MAG: hypothetical protein IIX34_01860 [Alistipes sp.]|nr:hypothetical protein [Alistipes sp.]